jgi:DNA repair protein RecO (recombination protein O)
MYVITSADLIDNFYYLRNNMDAFLYGSYILELIHYIALENMVDNKIFDMTVEILKNLSSSNENFDKLTAAYELKLVAMLGFKPDFYHCLHCSNDIKTDVILSIEEGGFYCPNCVNNGNGINVLYNEILTLRKILKIKFKDINTVENINSKVMNLIRKFLFYHIGKNNFITLKLLNNE